MSAPSQPDSILHAATSAHRAGRFADAEAGYRQVLAGAPGNAAALHGLGVLCQQTGRPAEAIDLLRKAVEAAPSWAGGSTLLAAGCRSSLAAALGMQGRHAEAAELLREALRLEPRSAVIWSNLGLALRRLGDAAGAARAYRQAADLAPDDAEAPDRLGAALRAAGRLPGAVAAHREAIRRRPDYAQAQHNLATALADLGRAEESAECFRRLAELRPDSPGAGSDLLLSLHNLDGVEAARMFQEHVKWAQRHAAPLYLGAGAHEVPHAADRRLRVGYVSPHFREYPAARFFEPLLAGHDRRSFTLFCYSDVARPDAVTARLRAYGDAWRDIAGLADDRVRQLVRQDRIDILVDLAGHLANTRLPLFARKPAPVQVSYLGYPDTTGVRTIDYRITDEWHDPFDSAQDAPPGTSEAYHTEELIRLPRSCWSYVPGDDLPPAGGLPAASTGGITFGVMNRLVKVTPRMMALWGRILAAVPHSRLMVLVARGVEAEPSVCERFGAAGIDTGRLVFVAHRPRREYLELFNQVDVGLDTLPYAGMTTTCDGLWMGVPTVTLAGQAHVSRTGVSLLSAVGLPELIARTQEQYIETAVGLASDLPRLAALRARLREQVERSALADGAGLAAAIEAAYRDMWHKWCAGAAGLTLGPSC